MSFTQLNEVELVEAVLRIQFPERRPARFGMHIETIRDANWVDVLENDEAQKWLDANS